MRLGQGWESSQPHVTGTPILLIQGNVFPVMALALVHTHSLLIYRFRITDASWVLDINSFLGTFTL